MFDAIGSDEDVFEIKTDRGSFAADFVIWACGHFGDPSTDGLPGAEHGRHYSTVKSWQDVSGDEVYVIGGYESGIDAAITAGLTAIAFAGVNTPDITGSSFDAFNGRGLVLIAKELLSG